MGTFGVMEELASDGASVYKSAEVQEFLTRFGVRHRVSSAYNPHSNQLAEGAVKSAKRMLEDNTGAQGNLKTDKFLPHQPGKLKTSSRWHKVLKMREVIMARRHITRGQELNKHTRELAPLKVGEVVSIQNQQRNSPLKWDHTGTVVEIGNFDKYTVKVDGSRRLADRSRRFLRPIRCYKRTISPPEPAPADPTEPPRPMAATPAATGPRRSEMIIKRSYAAITSSRSSHQ